MAIPTIRILLLPILQCLEDGTKLTHRELIARVAKRIDLTEEDLMARNSSGSQLKIYERVTWAVVHMRNARLVQSVGRGITRITERGRALLAENPSEISYKMLKERYPEYAEFDRVGQQKRKEKLLEAARRKKEIQQSQAAGVGIQPEKPAAVPGSTPAGVSPPEPKRVAVARKGRQRQNLSQLEKTLESNIQALQNVLESDVMHRVSGLDDSQLSRVVLALLRKMGYGESSEDTGTTQSLVNGATIEDALGLNQMYACVTTG